MRRSLLAACLLAACAAAGAQTMYRCGNTFSQTPCGSDAKSAAVPRSESGGVAGSGEAGAVKPRAQPCLAELAQRVGVEGPGALKIGRMEGPKVEAIDVKGEKLVVRTYEFTALTRNAYGGQTPAATFTCHLSEDEQRVVRLNERAGGR
jgi:hypothetical protein